MRALNRSDLKRELLTNSPRGNQPGLHSRNVNGVPRINTFLHPFIPQHTWNPGSFWWTSLRRESHCFRLLKRNRMQACALMLNDLNFWSSLICHHVIQLGLCTSTPHLRTQEVSLSNLIIILFFSWKNHQHYLYVPSTARLYFVLHRKKNFIWTITIMDL